MLKIQCPKCNKSFLWTDEMPTQGNCSTPDCDWVYDVHRELGKNVSHHEKNVEATTILCPYCRNEIASKFTICSKCGHVVVVNKAFRKSYIFLVGCLILILLSYIFNYWVK